MNIVVFGSTGTIGKHVLSQALEQGHHVTAFCRDRENLIGLKHPNLIMLEGDVMNFEDVKNATIKKDVAIVVLGSGKSRKSIVRSAGTKNIIEAMQLNKVNRLICQSTLGTFESNKNLNFFWKRIMFGWFLKQIFLDHELQEQYVKESGLDWTIVRPSAFTNGEKTEKYLHGFSANEQDLKLKISRSDVADFILKQVNNNAYLHQTPGLSY